MAEVGLWRPRSHAVEHSVSIPVVSIDRFLIAFNVLAARCRHKDWLHPPESGASSTRDFGVSRSERRPDVRFCGTVLQRVSGSNRDPIQGDYRMTE
jgi:hypothetical protein